MESHVKIESLDRFIVLPETDKLGHAFTGASPIHKLALSIIAEAKGERLIKIFEEIRKAITSLRQAAIAA